VTFVPTEKNPKSDDLEASLRTGDKLIYRTLKQSDTTARGQCYKTFKAVIY
jgi:hypothetical protein